MEGALEYGVGGNQRVKVRNTGYLNGVCVYTNNGLFNLVNVTNHAIYMFLIAGLTVSLHACMDGIRK